MKKTVIILSFLLTALFIGCRSTKEQIDETIEQIEVEIPDTSAEEPLLYEGDKKSCVIQEDEEYIYSCGSYRIVRIDKETNESRILWEKPELSGIEELYLYSEGSGLLIDDKIYFIEEWTERTGNGTTKNRAFSVINTDGTGHEMIKQLEDSLGLVSMLLQDGVLYVESNNGSLSYYIYADGSFSKIEEQEEIEENNSYPEGYSEVSYRDNGYRTLFAPESMKNFGGVILHSYRNSDLLKIIPETGEIFDLSQFGSTLKAFNSRYFLISSGQRGSYLVDVHTLDARKVSEDSMEVITMDEDYIYTKSNIFTEGEIKCVYEKISLDTGVKSIIFMQEYPKAAYYESWYDLMDPVIKGGYLYYAGEQDYKLYLMRRSLENPSKEEILGEAFYDSGIGEVGTLEVYHERLNGGTENFKVMIDIDLEWLQVDSRFPGAAKINECLAEEQKRNIDYEKELVERNQEEAEEYESKREADQEENQSDEEETRWRFAYTSEFREMTYFDGHYLSFYQLEDDYQGGAHGILYQKPYTFDLQTGDRLKLDDIVADSQEELKDIVTEYFAEMIQLQPEYYLKDAMDTVRDWTGFESSFYLTEDGIRFFLPPYAIACFAAGFQEVTVPYEEFEMKIPLGSQG